MIIEEGKFYRTTDGEKIGPMVRYDGLWWRFKSDIKKRLWSNKGYRYSTAENVNNVVAEWTDEPKSPIVTKTVKSLEAGVYNNVALALNEHCGWRYCLPLNNYTKEELRAAAKTLLEIADFLEGEDK